MRREPRGVHDRSNDVESPRAPRRMRASSSMQPSHEPLEDLLFLVLIAALAWAPLWLGGNRPFAWGVNAILFPGAALLYELALLVRPRPHPVAPKALAIPLGLFAIIVVWMFIQMSTATPAGWRHPIWSMAGELLQHPLAGSISVDRDLTALALLRLITAASAFWISAQLCARAERAEFLVRAVGAIVAVYAVYGLVSQALFSSAIFWFDAPVGPGSLRSTFVNRNSFAAYAGLGLIATIGALLQLYRRDTAPRSGSFVRRLADFVEDCRLSTWLFLGAAMITFVALLRSGSRGGVSSTALGLFVLFALSIMRDRRHAEHGIEAVVFAMIVITAGVFFFGDIFVGRIVSDGVGDVDRLAVYSITLRSILDSPILGFGAGTFAEVFPMYRDRSISVIEVWDKAHNSYLDVFQGLGLVFGTLLLGALAYIACKCVIGAATRRIYTTPSTVAAAVAALATVDALIDFSVEMQGTTLTFMALLGAGFAQSESPRRASVD